MLQTYAGSICTPYQVHTEETATAASGAPLRRCIWCTLEALHQEQCRNFGTSGVGSGVLKRIASVTSGMKDVTCATYPARLPQVKANYFREKILEVLRVIAVLRVHVLRILRVPGSILRFSTCTADTARLAVFRGSLLHQLWILPVLQNISGFCIAGIAGTASTECSEYQNTLNMSSILGV